MREVNRFGMWFAVSEGSLGDPSPVVYQEVVGVIHPIRDALSKENLKALITSTKSLLLLIIIMC